MSLSDKLTIADLGDAIKDKRVLIRVDFNVPMDKDKNITNDQRIVAALNTIEYALNQGAARVVLMSHLGRPDGEPNEKYTLAPVAERLQKLLETSSTLKRERFGTPDKVPVTFVKNYFGPTIDEALNDASNQIILLENLRFNIEEEVTVKKKGEKIKANPDNVKAFEKALSSLGDVYINDAFGTAHRAHSSMVGIHKGNNKVPRAAGLLMEKELTYFAKVLDDDQKQTPFLAILGGAKVKDKIALIDKMLDKVNSLIIGGGMAFTFLKEEKQMNIGKSLFDEENAKTVKNLVEKASLKKVDLILPVDFVTGRFEDGTPVKVGEATLEGGIPDDAMGLDVGPKSSADFRKAILGGEGVQAPRTILWNGPAGVFEHKDFAEGSRELLKAVIEAAKQGAIVVIGGGDTATVVETLSVENNDEKKFIGHISTGGGASLELLEGKQLPGVVALSNKSEWLTQN
ncbi:phosphoglycerate kinase [Phlebopus sp. FC_14]|nr:phosphoglycerate kinase [Phlebopus sp. FC_14]